MEERSEPVLKDILDILTEIRDMLRVGTMPDIQKVLSNALKTEAQLSAYDLSDGKRTQVEIAKAVGMDQKSVSNWWRRWNQIGITVESDSFARRQKKVFDLAAYSIRPGRTSGDVEEGLEESD